MLLSDIFLLISYCEENEISRGTFEMSALPLPNLGKIFLDWRKEEVHRAAAIRYSWKRSWSAATRVSEVVARIPASPGFKGSSNKQR